MSGFFWKQNDKTSKLRSETETEVNMRCQNWELNKDKISRDDDREEQ